MNTQISKEQFQARIVAANGDATQLIAIENELAQLRGVPWALPLRIRVIRSRSASGDNSSAVLPFRLPQAERGKPLYAYRLNGPQFVQLEQHLKRKTRTGALNGRPDQAAFVLWAGEWFRRCFTGGQQRWADLGERIGLTQSQAEWRALADSGLSYWGIGPLRLHGSTQRLLNLARQGGFPTAAIEDPAGWASRYLENLVGVLLDVDGLTSELAYDFAEGLQHILPDGWRYQDFYLVSADLAHAVVRLRREAQAGGIAGSLPASIWLDQQRKGWRSELPLVVDSDAARTLIDGLMKVEHVRGGNSSIQVERFLSRVGQSWLPRISLHLTGEIPSGHFASLSGEWNRLRMFAAGQMAGMISGELALLERGDNDQWLARASKGPALLPLALSVPVEVEFRGGGERAGPVMILNNGESVRSPLLVLQAPDDDGLQDPRSLKVVGAGSGGYRAEPLYVLAPLAWLVRPDGDTATAERREMAQDGRQLWKVSGVVTVLSDRDDVYLIRSGQDREERDRLILVGDRLTGAEGSANQEVFLASPNFFLREDRRDRAPVSGDIWWRPSGTTVWRANGVGRPLGECEFSWRNPATGHIRDRASVIVLPADFELQIPVQTHTSDLSIRGWPGQCTFNGESGDGAAHSWAIGDYGALPPVATIYLQSETVAVFRLRVRMPRRTGIGTWDGQLAQDRQIIALADLHKYLVVAHGRQSLIARLRDSSRKYVEQGERRWSFDDELPLTALHDEMAAMLRPLGDIDATIEIAVAGSSSHWFVSEFDASFKVEGDRLVLTKSLLRNDIKVIARPLHDPATEHVHDVVCLDAEWSLIREGLPQEGVWLLYLRSGDEVLTRPYLHVGAKLPEVPDGDLAAVMADSDHRARQLAINALCDRMEDGYQADVIFDEMLLLIESLNGLPPATFDILASVFKRPALTVKLLFRASPAQRPLVLAIENGLPFTWSCLPKQAWDDVAREHFGAILGLLPPSLANDFSLPAGAVSSVRRSIRDWKPELAPLLDLAPTTGPLSDLAQSFIQRAHDRAMGFGVSPFRKDMASVLPRWPFDAEFFRALDAPCAAALAARGMVTLTGLQLRCVKDVARRHPRYFLEAFAAYFKELSVG